MKSAFGELAKIVEALGESVEFCAVGSSTAVLPGLDVEGVGAVGIPISADDAQRLIGRASQAPYGRGEETIVDTDVRRVWQLEPHQFALSAIRPGTRSSRAWSRRCASSSALESRSARNSTSC